jgi:hypothetical protein
MQDMLPGSRLPRLSGDEIAIQERAPALHLQRFWNVAVKRDSSRKQCVKPPLA